jgi:Flp pilus assembly protein TadD
MACGVMAAHADPYEDVSKLADKGELAQALTQAEAYITENPRDAQMRFVRGVLLIRQNQVVQATEVFETLIAQYPELPEPYNNLALLYARSGELDKAREALEMALRNHPGYTIALQNLADVYDALAQRARLQAQQAGAPRPVPQPK